MSEMSKSARAAMKSKIKRMLTNDPHKKVDASSWTPTDALNADAKTGLRPISPRAYKRGGKVQGFEALKHAGRKPRKSGGRAGSSPITADSLVNRDVKEANAEFGKPHVGGYKRGGRTKKMDGGMMQQDPRMGMVGRSRLNMSNQPPVYKKGGKVDHDDVAEDKRLIKSMVKPGAIRSGKASGGLQTGKKSKEKSDLVEKAMKMAIKTRGVDPYDTEPSQGKAYKTLWSLRQGKPEYKHGGEIHAASCCCKKCGGARKADGGATDTAGMPADVANDYRAAHPAPAKTAPPKAPPPKAESPNDEMANERRAADLAAAARKAGKNHGGRAARKRGGRTGKGKTNIIIAINPHSRAEQPPAGAIPPQQQPARPVPVMPPAPMGAGAAPPAMGGGAPAGLAAALSAGQPNPLARKSGGKVGHRVYRSYRDMDAGAGSGFGRLEKTSIHKRK